LIGERRTLVSLSAIVVALVALTQIGDFGAALAPSRLPAVAGISAATVSAAAGSYQCAGCSVVLVSLDTLRADRVGAYGYDRPTTPTIDRFARDAAVFGTAITVASSTLRSHTSIFTSLNVLQHQARIQPPTPLVEEALTLAEVLSAEGYETASFNADGQLNELYQLSQGFDLYDAEAVRPLRKASARAFEWLDARPRDRFFLFLHSYEVHTPYEPTAEDWAVLGVDEGTGLTPRVSMGTLENLNSKLFKDRPSFTPAEARHVSAAYDAGIPAADEAFGSLLQGLRERGLYDDLLIILISDHGEELGERVRLGAHAYSTYDEILKVPLLIKFPASSFASAVVSSQVRTLDVAPTVTDVLRVATPPSFQGKSLVPVLTGADRSVRLALSEGRPGSFSVRTDRWKYVEGRLFDLAWDPGEVTDVGDHFGAVRRAMQAELARLIGLPGIEGALQVQPSEETLRQLRALGYVR